MRLVSSQGEFVRGRCGSTNQCDYCAKLAAVENTEMLWLDAMNGGAPEVWCVLTTRTATMDMSRFYDSRRAVLKALQRRWPACEAATLLEFTTGYGPRAGGRRRPHWNVFLKGVPVASVDEVAATVRRVWCAREDALPERQHVGPVGEMRGLTRYVAMHFQKESQKPPAGFSGHRFRATKGYFDGGVKTARAEATESLRRARALKSALDSGLTGDDAIAAADRARAIAAETSWELRHMTLDQMRGGDQADLAIRERRQARRDDDLDVSIAPDVLAALADGQDDVVLEMRMVDGCLGVGLAS